MCLSVPGELIEIRGTDELSRSGKVSFGGVTQEVNLSCLPEARVGDFVLVHVGFGLSIVDRKEAAFLLEYLRGNTE